MMFKKTVALVVSVLTLTVTFSGVVAVDRPTYVPSPTPGTAVGCQEFGPCANGIVSPSTDNNYCMDNPQALGFAGDATGSPTDYHRYANDNAVGILDFGNQLAGQVAWGSCVASVQVGDLATAIGTLTGPIAPPSTGILAVNQATDGLLGGDGLYQDQCLGLLGTGSDGEFEYGSDAAMLNVRLGWTTEPAFATGATNPNAGLQAGAGAAACLAPAATAHHGPDTTIYVGDFVNGGDIGFSVYADWSPPASLSADASDDNLRSFAPVSMVRCGDGVLDPCNAPGSMGRKSLQQDAETLDTIGAVSLVTGLILPLPTTPAQLSANLASMNACNPLDYGQHVSPSGIVTALDGSNQLALGTSTGGTPTTPNSWTAPSTTTLANFGNGGAAGDLFVVLDTKPSGSCYSDSSTDCATTIRDQATGDANDTFGEGTVSCVDDPPVYGPPISTTLPPSCALPTASAWAAYGARTATSLLNDPFVNFTEACANTITNDTVENTTPTGSGSAHCIGYAPINAKDAALRQANPWLDLESQASAQAYSDVGFSAPTTGWIWTGVASVANPPSPINLDCLDPSAEYIAQLIESAPRLSGEPINATVQNLANETSLPQVYAVADWVLDASGPVVNVVSGIAQFGATLVLNCVAQSTALTLTDPAGHALTTTSTKRGVADFYDLDYNQTGVWSLTYTTNGTLITTFTTGNLPHATSSIAPPKMPSASVCDGGCDGYPPTGPQPPTGTPTTNDPQSSQKPPPCAEAWANTRYLSGTTGFTQYPLSTEDTNPYASEGFWLSDHWDNECGTKVDDYGDLNFAVDVTGASMDMNGSFAAVALSSTGSKADHGLTPSGQSTYTIYTEKNMGVVVDTRADSQVTGPPTTGAAYQAHGSSTVGTSFGSVVDLACNFVTDSMPRWAGSIICGGVNIITDTGGDAGVVTPTQTGGSDPSNGEPSVGMTFTYDDIPSPYETSTTMLISKTSGATTFYGFTTSVTTDSYIGAYKFNPGIQQTWILHMELKNAAPPNTT